MPKNRQTCDCNIIHVKAVEETSGKMSPESHFVRISDFFKIMGDPTRCKIIFALLQRELCVCDLSNILSMSKSSVSHQLSKMRESGVVRFRREGKEVFYSLDDSHVAGIFTMTEDHIRHLCTEECHTDELPAGEAEQ